MSLQFSQARQRLYHLSRAYAPRLAEAAFWIAQEEYPSLVPTEALAELDRMAQELRSRLPEEPYPLKIIQAIKRYLFQDLGFVGNEAEYYDPRNSYLNKVLDRRRGIPITLSLIYLELAHQVGFPMEGINFPGHFLIRPVSDECEFFVDPFNQGEILFLQDCREKLSQVVGQDVEMSARFLQPITSQSFLVRMLNNLKHIYLSHQDVERSLAACERILLVDPTQIDELRDRGLLYFQMGRWHEARQDICDYLRESGHAEDRDMLNKLLRQIDQDSAH
ncbi:MAG: transglutaminase-like domain-containing protein [Cyanobacteria bacterium P01_F01_bin.42]